MSGNGTGNQTVRVCKDRVDSPIQISEGFLRIIGPEQVAAHSMAVGAVNHLLCACGFIKLQLLAAVLNRPVHNFRRISSPRSAATGDIGCDVQSRAQDTRPSDDIGMVPAVVSVQ